MKILSTIIFFLSTALCKSQSLNNFRATADSLINSYFSASAIQKINCENYEYRTFCHGDAVMQLSCNATKDPNKFDNEGCKFNLVGVSYSIYSSELGERLFFTIPVDSSKREFLSSILSQKIPNCIKENSFCNYISKDSALRIANSMFKNKRLLSASFIKNRLDKQYYWEAIWIPNDENDNASILCINAITGKIIEPKYFKAY